MATSLPKISVVTPSFNHQTYLETALRSVIDQKYPSLEYFVIDGGSTDGSQSIIEKYENAISYWCSEKDEGQSDAIAKGFAMATGDILGWINSDDAYFPDALIRVGGYFSKHPEVDVVTAGTVYTDPDGRITSCYERPRALWWFAQRGITYYGQQAMFFRRSIYEKAGGIRRDFHFLMDTELLFRLLRSGAKSGSFRGLCGFFRWHPQMKSIRRQGRKAEERKIMEREYDFGIPQYTQETARALYRTWQMLNGNYLLSYLETKKLKGKSISEIWSW